VNPHGLETIGHFLDRAIKPVDPGHQDSEPVGVELAYVFVHGFSVRRFKNHHPNHPLIPSLPRLSIAQT
jgi:hypothetical protein